MEAGRIAPVTTIREIAGARPEAVALLGIDGRTVTYGQLVRHVDTTAAALVAAGVAPGHRVVILAPPGVDAALAFLGVSAVADAAPLNLAATPAELGRALDLLAPRLIVVAPGDRAGAGIRPAAATHGVPVHELTAEPVGAEAPPVRTDDGQVALTLATSGTTATPKLVPLTHANLGHSAGNVREALHLTPADRCLNVMPLFHIHGLVAALLASLTAGGSVICAPGLDEARFAGWLAGLCPTWYTAVPSIHQAVLGLLARDEVAARDASRAGLRLIRSSSSALPPTVLHGLESRFGAPVVEAYGMTEAAHQIATNELPPGERRPGSVGRPYNVDVRILGADGSPAASGEPGEVVIRGLSVTGGYSAPPEANATAFVDGWLRTGDQGYLDRDGYLVLTGRLKELINRGGEKIAPRDVEEELLAHPGIGEVAAFAVPDDDLGEVVGVAVVPSAPGAVTETDVRAHARQRLAYFKVPRHVVITAALPKGATGKVQRATLAAQLGLSGNSNPRPVGPSRPPATPLEADLVEAIGSVLGGAPPGVADDFIALGCDSLRGNRILAYVRRRHGVELDLGRFFAAGTVERLAVAITERQLNGYAADEVEEILAGVLDTRETR
jgi:acyl-CoA synthetase (AMP-forming)/AMP-acid ligase II